MPRLNTLLGAAAFTKLVLGERHARQLVPRVSAVITLSVSTAILLGALLLVLLYGAYRLMVLYGISPDMALLLGGLLLALTTFLFVFLTIKTIRRCKNALRLGSMPEQVGEIANAFVDGLRGK